MHQGKGHGTEGMDAVYLKHITHIGFGLQAARSVDHKEHHSWKRRGKSFGHNLAGSRPGEDLNLARGVCNDIFWGGVAPLFTEPYHLQGNHM